MINLQDGCVWTDLDAGAANSVVEESLSLLYVCGFFSGFPSAAVTDATGENIDPGLEVRFAGTVKMERSEDQTRRDHHREKPLQLHAEWRKRSRIHHVCV